MDLKDEKCAFSLRPSNERPHDRWMIGEVAGFRRLRI